MWTARGGTEPELAVDAPSRPRGRWLVAVFAVRLARAAVGARGPRPVRSTRCGRRARAALAKAGPRTPVALSARLLRRLRIVHRRCPPPRIVPRGARLLSSAWSAWWPADHCGSAGGWSSAGAGLPSRGRTRGSAARRAARPDRDRRSAPRVGRPGACRGLRAGRRRAGCARHRACRTPDGSRLTVHGTRRPARRLLDARPPQQPRAQGAPRDAHGRAERRRAQSPDPTPVATARLRSAPGPQRRRRPVVPCGPRRPAVGSSTAASSVHGREAASGSTRRRAVGGVLQVLGARSGVTASRRSPRSEPTKSATKSLAGRAEHACAGSANCSRTPADAEHRDPVAEPHGLVDVVGDEHARSCRARPAAAGTRPAAGRGRSGRRRRTARPSAAPAGRRPAPGRRRPAAADRRTARAGSGRAYRPGRGPTSSSSSSTRSRAPRLGPSPAAAARSRRCARRLVREQPDLLDDVADAAAQLDRVDVRDVLAVELDPAGGRLDQPVDHPQRRRLAAAGRPDERDQLAAADVEVELAHGDRCRRRSACPRPPDGSSVLGGSPVCVAAADGIGGPADGPDSSTLTSTSPRTACVATTGSAGST